MIKALINSISPLFIKQRVKYIKYFINYPIEAQRNLLYTLISTASNVFFGKKYRFKEIKNYQDFVKRVPLHYYKDILPFVERIKKGEKNVLWPGRIKWIAKSAGTTNDKSKYIPITIDCINQCHYKAGKDLIALYVINNPNTNLFYGKSFRLGGSYNKYLNFYCGDISSILIKKLPIWADYFSVPKKKIVLINEWELKIDLIIKEIYKENIVSLFGIPSWMLIILNRILNIYNKKYIDDIWSNIEVFFHGGVTFDPYLYQYKNIFRKNINYYNIYNASEGFFGIQDQNNSKDLLLLLNHGIFYEFIPIEEINNEFPYTISIEEVKLNQNYVMVISTNTGLWRYIIGDTIKFTCLFPYRIVITGRTKEFINVFGEELIVENADKALIKTCSITNAIIKEYTVGPVYMKRNLLGAHEWIIEFKKKPINIEYFSYILDNNLKLLNSDYEAKRYKNITLLAPIIIIARKGLFYDWFKHYNKLGGQNKIPRLSNNRKYLDILIKMNY